MRKKFLKSGVIAMMAVCGLSFVSCSEDNDEGMKSYKLTVSYSLPSDVEASNVESLSSFWVRLPKTTRCPWTPTRKR